LVSGFVLPTQLTERAESLLWRLLSVVEEETNEVPPEGIPPSAMTTVMRVSKHRTRRNTERALADLEAAQLVRRSYVPRKGHRGGELLRLHVVRLRRDGQCEIGCGRIAENTGRFCARCKQILGRRDRSWQAAAIELHWQGVSPLRIAVILGREPWRGSGGDGRDPNGGAVVPYLMGQGLLDPREWAERLREATRGSSSDDH
jgi:hypothetical protein